MNETYQGELFKSNDKYIRKGYGIYHYENGDVYEGEWDNNDKSGLGEYIYSDGSVYRGEWLKDKKHGKGTLFAHSLMFEGEWKEDDLINAFVFSIEIPDKIDIDDNFVTRLEVKRKTSTLPTNNTLDDNKINKELKIDKLFDLYSDHYDKNILERLEKENNNFCVHIELISFILDQKNQYEEIFDKCKEITGICENCESINEGRKRVFNYECKKIKSFIKNYFREKKQNQ
jgi:hypothetical protein